MSDYADEDFDDEADDAFECPTCRGTGYVNPLTPNLPDDFLCLSTTECPSMCDKIDHCLAKARGRSLT